MQRFKKNRFQMTESRGDRIGRIQGRGQSVHERKIGLIAEALMENGDRPAEIVGHADVRTGRPITLAYIPPPRVSSELEMPAKRKKVVARSKHPV